jgi:hypothetical protein
MNYYPLYVFDGYRHKDILPPPVTRAEEVRELVQQLQNKVVELLSVWVGVLLVTVMFYRFSRQVNAKKIFSG